LIIALAYVPLPPKINDNMKKQYETPQFKLVRQEESNKVFFVASGTQNAPKAGGTLGSMSKTPTNW